MTKYILFLMVCSVAFSACTVIVSDPHPRYVVSEIGYSGSRPVEVYSSGGYYYYAPCDGVPQAYYHTRVSYYNHSSMRVVTYRRPPTQTVVIKEEPRRTNTVVIKEEPRRTNTVVIKEEPRRSNTVVIKEEPKRQNTTVIKESPSRRTPSSSNSSRTRNGQDDNTIIIKK